MNKKFTFIIISLILISIITLTFLKLSQRTLDTEHTDEDSSSTQISDDSLRKLGVTIAKAGQTTIPQSLSLSGNITLNQNLQGDVKARFPGIVKEVLVNLGDNVKKNQILAVVESNESLRTYDIVAPIQGTVLAKETSIGDVANSESLFTVADLSSVWAKFHIFSEDSNKIKKENKVIISSTDEQIKATGKIDMLFPLADEPSQTYTVIVNLENNDGKWKPGMTIKGQVIFSERTVPVAVTEDAIQRSQDGKDVIFIKRGNRYKMQEVLLGAKGGGYVEIVKGINLGDEYVSKGSVVIKLDLLKSTAGHDD